MNSFKTSQPKPLIHDESLKRKKVQEKTFSTVSEGTLHLPFLEYPQTDKDRRTILRVRSPKSEDLHGMMARKEKRRKGPDVRRRSLKQRPITPMPHFVTGVI
jgi:hypothetical protein